VFVMREYTCARKHVSSLKDWGHLQMPIAFQSTNHF
jgi:hypothetical protein